MKQLLICITALTLLSVFFPHSVNCQELKKIRLVEVPFEFYRNSVIVQVKVNGKGPFNMLLDTGTSPSVIELETAQELGLKLKPINNENKGENSGKLAPSETILSRLSLGSLEANDVAALAIKSLAGISQQLGKPLQGVLGYSLLKDRIVQFDYSKQVIRFYSDFSYPKAGKRQKNRIVLPFKLYEDTPLIEDIYVNGKKIKATLDTGSNGTLRLTSTGVKTLGLEEEAMKSATVSATGYGGSAENRKGQIKSLAVGNLVLNDQAVTFVMKKREDEPLLPEGNLGNVFMSNFSITFDYRKMSVTFEKN